MGKVGAWKFAQRDRPGWMDVLSDAACVPRRIFLIDDDDNNNISFFFLNEDTFMKSRNFLTSLAKVSKISSSFFRKCGKLSSQHDDFAVLKLSISFTTSF